MLTPTPSNCASTPSLLKSSPPGAAGAGAGAAAGARFGICGGEAGATCGQHVTLRATLCQRVVKAAFISSAGIYNWCSVTVTVIFPWGE